MTANSTGNCYLCGESLTKMAMKNHLLKHYNEESGQGCILLKIEGMYRKEYWLYIDIPVEAPLFCVDDFLRKIWLECCGHCSEFYGQGHSEIDENRKLGTFLAGDKFFHAYDFGTTTETVITSMGIIRRKSQKEVVRLLARNVPPVFQCASCGKTAKSICTECSYESDNPFFCAACGRKHDKEHGEEMMLPITNSPRMGECGYSGELDTYEFNPAPAASKIIPLPKKQRRV
jgi:hypothetical protein